MRHQSVVPVEGGGRRGTCPGGGATTCSRVGVLRCRHSTANAMVVIVSSWVGRLRGGDSCPAHSSRQVASDAAYRRHGGQSGPPVLAQPQWRWLHHQRHADRKLITGRLTCKHTHTHACIAYIHTSHWRCQGNPGDQLSNLFIYLNQAARPIKHIKTADTHNKKQDRKKCSERHKHCALAVVRRSRKFSPRRRPPSLGHRKAKI